MSKRIFFVPQILALFSVLFFINSSHAGIVDSIRSKWNAHWMAQFKKDLTYSETEASASSLINRYDSLQKNIVEQRQLIEDTGKMVKKAKSGNIERLKELKNSLLDLKSDLVHLEDQRDTLLRDFKSRRSELVKINRSYQATQVSGPQNNLNDAKKLLEYKELLSVRGKNAGERLSLDTIEGRLKSQITHPNPIRNFESSDVATRYSNPLKQARLEKTMYKEFLKKAEKYGRTTCRSQGKRFVSAELALNEDQNSVFPNRKISRITLGESMENSFYKAAIGLGIGATLRAVGGFVGTLRWIDSLGPVRAVSQAQADEQAILGLMVATMGGVAGSAGGFLASLIPAGLLMLVDGLKNYYLNHGKELGPRKFMSSSWLHDYAVETQALSAQKIPHVEVVVQCAGTEVAPNLMADSTRPYVSRSVAPHGDFEWINTANRLLGNNSHPPITGEFSYSNGFRSSSAW